MTVPHDALRLAGFAIAHAAWSIEDGETLCTLAFVEVDGKRELVRYVADTIPESVEAADADLTPRLSSGGHAAVVFDGYVTPEGDARTDALICLVFGPGMERLGTIYQRYRPGRRSRVPLVGRSTKASFLGLPEATDELGDDADTLVLEGAREHPQAAGFWP